DEQVGKVLTITQLRVQSLRCCLWHMGTLAERNGTVTYVLLNVIVNDLCLLELAQRFRLFIREQIVEQFSDLVLLLCLVDQNIRIPVSDLLPVWYRGDMQHHSHIAGVWH